MNPTLLYTSLPNPFPTHTKSYAIYTPMPQKPTYFIQVQDYPSTAWLINKAQIEYSHPKHTVHLHDS